MKRDYIYTDAIFKVEMVKTTIAGNTYRFTVREVLDTAKALGIRAASVTTALASIHVQYALLQRARRKG